MIGIYKFTNKITGESYIGQSVDIQKRYNQHKNRCLIRNGEINARENTYFHSQLRDYGFENFDFEIIEECKREELDEKEIYYIKFFNTLYPNGYNLTEGGQECNGHLNKLKNFTDIDEIRELLLNSTLSNSEIGELYGVCDQTISDINCGRIWIDDNIEYPIRKRKRKKYFCKGCGKEISYKARNTGMCGHCCRRYYIKDDNSNKSKKSKSHIAHHSRIPDKETLYNLLVSKHNFEEVGRLFGVTGNAVRKWCDSYNIPRHTKDYKLLFEKENNVNEIKI